MGLDWCVEQKVRPGMQERISGREKKVQEIGDRLEKAWKDFLKDKEEEEPGVSSHPLREEFSSLPRTVEMRAKYDAAKQALDACYISGFETIGCPRIGIDDSATEWFRQTIRKNRQTSTPNKRFLEYWNQDEELLLKDNHGKFVSDLATEKGGHGTIIGMLSSDIGFRGKIVGSSNIVPENLKSEAYADHDPEVLVSYGHALMDVAEDYARSRNLPWPLLEDPPNDDEDRRELKYLVDAANWCIFWGERGHGMHAWY